MNFGLLRSAFVVGVVLLFSACLPTGMQRIHDLERIRKITGLQSLPQPETAFLLAGQDLGIWARFQIRQGELDSLLETMGMTGRLRDESDDWRILTEIREPDTEDQKVEFFPEKATILKVGTKDVPGRRQLTVVVAETEKSKQAGNLLVFLTTSGVK